MTPGHRKSIIQQLGSQDEMGEEEKILSLTNEAAGETLFSTLTVKGQRIISKFLFFLFFLPLTPVF